LKEEFTSASISGIVFALMAGAFWASYIIYGQKISSELHGGQIVCLGMIVGTLCVAPLGLVLDGAKIFNLSILPQAFALAVLSSALPYSLEMIGLQNIPAKTFGILMSLEPALGAFSGLLLLNEHLSFQQWTAILCVVAASAGSSFLGRKEKIQEQPTY
jgi:inner membrane transporter RhtA